MNIREYLKKSKLIADGSFGTYYSQKYKTVDIPEYANITASQRISEIHTEYINSGAKLIRTNTFARLTVTVLIHAELHNYKRITFLFNSLYCRHNMFGLCKGFKT